MWGGRAWEWAAGLTLLEVEAFEDAEHKEDHADPRKRRVPGSTFHASAHSTRFLRLAPPDVSSSSVNIHRE
eukprot:2679391-Rhodomonas_salina.2